MTHTCLNELSIEHSGTVASVIYFFQLAQVHNELPVKKSSLFSFFDVLKRKCWSSLSVALFINNVIKKMHQQYFKCFQLTAFSPLGLLTFKWFFVCATQKSLVGMYNINEKNSKVKVTGRTFTDNLNGKL